MAFTFPTTYLDFWVDGHFWAARTAEDALAGVSHAYGYQAEVVRPWTDEDQAELDFQTGTEG